jgi:ubiquitin carboxyl-terminal hydrolase 4/11/15
VIRRKVLEKVATLTTHPAFNQEEESDEDGSSENIDPDLVVTTASDADSSGDGKVMATSIDGEDELVDITMKDSNGVRESIELHDNGASKSPHEQEL